MRLFCVLTVASFHGTTLLKACLSSTEIYVKIRRNGGMAERTKAPVLKTGMGKPIVGSNPTPSVRNSQIPGEVPEWTNGAAC